MEKKSVTQDMRNLLRAPLSEGAVTQHPTKTYLSSIKAIFVTERLSDVFGVGSYKIRTEQIGAVNSGMVVCKVSIEIPEYGIYLESFGGNDNGGETNKNFDLGDAYKGATTDAITKICSWLEIGIDVFKGINQPFKPKSDPNDKRPWLNINSEQWKAAIKFLKEGKNISIIETKYKISKANKEKLLTDAK